MQGNSVWRCGELSEAHAGQRHGIRSIRTNLWRAHAQYSTPMGVQSGALASLTRNGRKRRPRSRSSSFCFLTKKWRKEAQTKEVCALLLVILRPLVSAIHSRAAAGHVSSPSASARHGRAQGWGQEFWFHHHELRRDSVLGCVLPCLRCSKWGHIMLKRWVETSLSDSTGRCRREHVDGTSRTALRVRASTGNCDTRDRRDSSGRCEIHEPLLCSFTVL